MQGNCVSLLESLSAAPDEPARPHWHLLSMAWAVTLLAAGSAALPARPRGGVAMPNGIFWAPDVPPRAHYAIDCSIDPAEGVVTGRETIQLTNTSRRPLCRLALDWPLDADHTAQLRVEGQLVHTLPGVGPAHSGPPTLFDLPRPLAPRRRAHIEVTFRSKLEQAGSPPTLTLTGWHPRLWWGFATHDDFEVRVEAPQDYVVAATGSLDRETGRYHARDVRSFGLFLGKGLQSLESRAGDVEVRCLSTSAGADCARLLVVTATDVIAFYRERFGFYPYTSLTIVPGIDQPAGGYPVATGMVAIHGEERMAERPELHWRWIMAHEIGHQYWGEYVLERDTPRWLWIGLGIYADREYVRARGLALGKHRQLMARYTDAVREHLDTTLQRTPEQMAEVDFDFNNVAIHGKGFSIVSALACVLGRDTFDRVYCRCLREFAGRRLGAAELGQVAEKESRQDLGWFFDQWVGSNAYLSYQIASQTSASEGEEYVSRIGVERLGTLSMPVPVEARFEDGSCQRKLTDRLLDPDEVVFHSSAPLREARIDPDGELALVVPPPEPTVADLSRKVRQLPWTGGGDEALALLAEARRLGVSDADLWAKLGLALFDGRHYPEALEAFRRAADAAPQDSLWGFAALVWQGHLLDLAGQREEALKCYRAALLKAGGMQVQHSQYGMVIDRKWVAERLEKPFERP